MNSEKSFEIQIRLAERAKNYNWWIFETIKPFLGNRIVDVGCSIGNITRLFTDKKLVIGVDIDKSYLEMARQNCSHLKNFRTLRADASLSAFLSLKSEYIDTITCLNVLEHIKDDIVNYGLKFPTITV